MSQNWTPPPAGGSATVPNNMVLAIITIFCCWPLAIPAIIFAAKVNGQVAAGDIAGAQESSKKAKMFSFIGLGLGIAWWLFIGLFYGVAILAALAGGSR